MKEDMPESVPARPAAPSAKAVAARHPETCPPAPSSDQPEGARQTSADPGSRFRAPLVAAHFHGVNSLSMRLPGLPGLEQRQLIEQTLTIAPLVQRLLPSSWDRMNSLVGTQHHSDGNAP